MFVAAGLSVIYLLYPVTDQYFFFLGAPSLLRRIYEVRYVQNLTILLVPACQGMFLPIFNRCSKPYTPLPRKQANTLLTA